MVESELASNSHQARQVTLQVSCRCLFPFPAEVMGSKRCEAVPELKH